MTVSVLRHFALAACGAALLFAFDLTRASSREDDISFLAIHLATSPEVSLGQQEVNQNILERLLFVSATQLPDVAPCQIQHRYQIDYTFGDFALAVRHPSLSRRIACLR